MPPTFSLARRKACPARLSLPFVAVEVDFLDHPGLPAFLFRDGDAQVPRFNRGREVQTGVRFTHHAWRDHLPGLAIVGHFDTIERCPAKILAVFALLSARIDFDLQDRAAGGQLDSEPLNWEGFEALGEVSGLLITIEHCFEWGVFARLHVGSEFPLGAPLEALARYAERRKLTGEFFERPVV